MYQAQVLTRPRADEGTPANGVLPLIQLTSDLLARRMERFLTAQYGLTTPQYQLLLAAASDREMTLGGLSQSLSCSRGNVTGIVDRLERDGWIMRERSQEDRRVIAVRLTEKGEQIGTIAAELSVQLQDLLADWEPEQRHQLQRLLSRVYQKLKE
jgi:DNA-binding MarR family transcriptional regulator